MRDGGLITQQQTQSDVPGRSGGPPAFLSFKHKPCVCVTGSAATHNRLLPKTRPPSNWRKHANIGLAHQHHNNCSFQTHINRFFVLKIHVEPKWSPSKQVEYCVGSVFLSPASQINGGVTIPWRGPGHPNAALQRCSVLPHRRNPVGSRWDANMDGICRTSQNDHTRFTSRLQVFKFDKLLHLTVTNGGAGVHLQGRHRGTSLYLLACVQLYKFINWSTCCFSSSRVPLLCPRASA